MKGTNVTALSKDQKAFVAAMTTKQRNVLRQLAKWPHHTSATEAADLELRELVRNKLVQYHHGMPAGGLPIWGATAVGVKVAEQMGWR